jgi:hypothetical protein
MEMQPEEISRRLRAGRMVTDEDFDVWLPECAQWSSRRYWTQVGVAARVAQWLRARGAGSVLDIGSGVGKFCTVGALSSGLSFTGIEQREYLVDAACSLAARFGASGRARFVHGDLDSVDCTLFDALYFYNPFGENVAPIASRLDDSVELSRARFEADIARANAVLRRMPVGTHLVTYNGYGGRVPESFDLVHAKPANVRLLRLWRKAREHDAGGYWLELEDSTRFRAPGRLQLLEERPPY